MFLPMSWTSPFTVAIRNLPAYCESSSPWSGSRPMASSLARFSASMNGNKWATAFFMTRADLITCGRNILPAPKRSPTTFMPDMSGPSITANGVPPAALISRRISSVSGSTCSEMPLTKACVSRSATGRSRHDAFLTTATTPPRFRASAASFSASVAASNRSVASSRLFKTASSQTSWSCFGTSCRASISAALTMPMSMPDIAAAWCRKTAWIDSRIVLAPRKPNDRLETPPLILHQGHCSLMVLTASMKSTPYALCSSIPVPMVRMFGSKTMSSGGKHTGGATSKSYDRLQIRTLSSLVAAWPFSSNAMTTTAAPCLRSSVACSMKSFSPTLSEMEFTMALPWFHLRPASTMSNLDESIMNGALDTSGSVTAIFTNFCIAARPSSMPSSTLMSTMCAPASTWSLAMSMSSPYLPSMMRRLNLREPAMLHRSPTFTNGRPQLLYVSASTLKSSRPESHMRGGPSTGSGRGL
mmetsp:Transcript_27775/g.83268  ORF Transcript_27775/g.83268 Transcript_27775/m.83268 type:complete len:471 (+) Transcript_27775:1561-2973(+)